MPKIKDIGMDGIGTTLMFFLKAQYWPLRLVRLSCCFGFHKSEAPIVFEFYSGGKRKPQNFQHHTNGRSEILRRVVLNGQQGMAYVRSDSYVTTISFEINGFHIFCGMGLRLLALDTQELRYKRWTIHVYFHLPKRACPQKEVNLSSLV